MSKLVLYTVRLTLALAVLALISQTYLLAEYFTPATKTILHNPQNLFFVVEAWLYGFTISNPFFGSVTYDGAYPALIVILLALIVLKFCDGFRMVK